MRFLNTGSLFQPADVNGLSRLCDIITKLLGAPNFQLVKVPAFGHRKHMLPVRRQQ